MHIFAGKIDGYSYAYIDGLMDPVPHRGQNSVNRQVGKHGPVKNACQVSTEVTILTYI